MKQLTLACCLLLVVVLVSLGCVQSGSPGPNGSDQNSLNPLVFSLSVSDQNSSDNSVLVSSVELSSPGFVVIRKLKLSAGSGDYGDVVGVSGLMSGVSDLFRVSLSSDAVPTRLVGLLYQDNGDGIFSAEDNSVAGTANEFDFLKPGPDNGLPQIDSVVVSTQPLIDRSVRMDSVFLADPGFVVVRMPFENGEPGRVVGVSDLLQGSNANVVIPISGGEGSAFLFSELYFDDGNGFFTDQDLNRPVEPDGVKVSQKFRLVVSHSVVLKNFAFIPSRISIAAGDVVEFDNQDPVGHSIVIPGLGVDVSIGPGETRLQYFLDPGSFDYHCGIHPEMTGSISVS